MTLIQPQGKTELINSRYIVAYQVERDTTAAELRWQVRGTMTNGWVLLAATDDQAFAERIVAELGRVVAKGHGGPVSVGALVERLIDGRPARVF